MLGKHLRTGSFFTNYEFLTEENYFDFLKNEKKPLLHFWSLAVEEQFYLFWPLLLTLFYKTRYLFFTIITLMVISFSSNILLIQNSEREVFYLLHGRGWELLIGCLLAAYSFRKGEVSSFILKNFFAIAGLVGLYFSFSLVSIHKYPGQQALLPTLSAALLILAGPSALFNKYVLSRREVVYIGKISYPLYLWHWVLIAFANMYSFPEYAYSLCVFFAFLMAALSYELVEKPLKEVSQKARTKIFWGLGFTMIGFMLLGESIYNKKIGPLHSGPEYAQIVEAMTDTTDLTKFVTYVNEGDIEYSVFGKGKEKILLIGDSHMRMYVPYYLEHADLNKYKFYLVSQHACLIIETEDNRNICASFYRSALTLGKRTEFKKIIVASYWVNAFGFSDIANSLEATYSRKMANFDSFMKEISGPSKKIFILEGIPTGNEFDPYFMFRRNFYKASVTIRPTRFNLNKYLRDFKGFNKSLEDITNKYQGTYVRTIPTICPESRCEVMLNGRPIYFDKAHVRSFFILEKAHFLKTILDT